MGGQNTMDKTKSKIKYIYERENLLKPIEVFLGGVLPLIAITIYIKISNYSSEIMPLFYALCTIPTLILIFQFSRAIFWRNLNDKISSSSKSFDAMVIDHVMEYKKRAKNMEMEEYFLVVRYTDENGKEVEFETPQINFKPQEVCTTECKVYIYKGSPFASNFDSLPKRKFRWGGVIASILIFYLLPMVLIRVFLV